MKLYKIRAWVNKSTSKKAYTTEHPYYHEEVVVRLATAKRIFASCVREVKTWEGTQGIHSVKVDLFVPHIHKDGTLAYWPDNEKYIAQYNPNNLL